MADPGPNGPRWIRWLLLILVAVVASAVVFVLVADGTSNSTAQDSPTETADGTSDVSQRQVALADGREVYLECRGSGSPTVILESGYHDSADLWGETDAIPPAVPVDAFTQIASFTRVCAYDRPGTLRYTGDQPSVTARTSPASMPRTAEDVVADLHEVLGTSGEPGPFVLVAHSLGGVFSRLYAQTYSEEVAGLVFVDSFPIEIPELFGDKWSAYRAVVDAAGSQPDPDFEQIDVDASVAQVEAAAALDPDLPMVVITKTEPFAGLPPKLEGFTANDLETAWTAGALELVALGTRTPHWFATGSDHYVQVHQPDLVAAATRLVIERAESGA